MDSIDKDTLLHTSPETMRMACNALHSTLDDFFTNIDDWEDVYDVLYESTMMVGRAMREPMTPKLDPSGEEKDRMLRLTVASLYAKGYCLFRRAQPQMNDFGLAKELLKHHIHNAIDMTYSSFAEMRKEAESEA